MYNGEDHTFVICAYGESEYLGKVIESLIHQEIKSKILITTSTPSDFIKNAAVQYGIPLHVRNAKSDIAEDWNFAYKCAATPLVTLCHQDDVYRGDYLKKVLREANRARKPLLFFSDYTEIRNGRIKKGSLLVLIKKLMLFPLKIKMFRDKKPVRRFLLSMGNPICCPSVTYVKENLPSVIFKSGYRSNIDWEAWGSIARLDGEFVYIPRSLVRHRIHLNSTTSGMIRDDGRRLEDLDMLYRHWPKPVARFIHVFYKLSIKLNRS